MAENKLKIQHLRSKELVDGKPKLPTDLDEGEIAINFATGYETMAIKNADGKIVKFDNKVDENYKPTQYNGNFETLVTETNHVKAGDTNSKAFKSVENTMSTLVDEVYKNEKAIVTTFGTVGSATGIVDADGNISYQTKADAHYIATATSVHDATVLLDNSLKGVDDKNSTDINKLAESAGIKRNVETEAFDYQKETGAHYIQNATSVHDATVKLDNSLYGVETIVNGHQNQITAVKATADKNTTDIATSNTNIGNNTKGIEGLASSIGIEKDTEGTYSYPNDIGSNYFEDATSVINAMTDLDNEIYKVNSKVRKIVNATGLTTNTQGDTIYNVEGKAFYIQNATSVHDATKILDEKVKVNEVDIKDIARFTGVVNPDGNTFAYQKETNANFIQNATSVHDATVKLDTALKQIGPISLDFVELNGIKWLKYDFNDFIGHTYQWGSLGDETKSPFPPVYIDADTDNPQQNPAWTAIKSIVAPLSSNNEDEESAERTRLLSPSFDIIYHLTHGHARMAREFEYISLNQSNIQQTIQIGLGPFASTTWTFSYKENPDNFITLDAGVYKPAEIGAIVRVSNTNNNGQTNNAIANNSFFSYEGRIMGVLIK